jgi:hypothetical protein
MNKDDKNQSLLQLKRHHGMSVISQLVGIGSERNQQEHIKFHSYIDNLQCLEPRGTQLHRRSVNAFDQQQYVALSYTWDPSKDESKEPGQYQVENWDDNDFQRSSVRKCVLDRVLRYMFHENVNLLWIDAHCIPQDTCGIDGCDHPDCAQKRDAIQAMDLVYQLSEHPVALLGRQLSSLDELKLLTRILSGRLIQDNGTNFRISRNTSVSEVKKALSLLCKITQDKWWTRAWTFQENYRSGTRMTLLIRHDPSLEQEKLRGRKLFGEIPNELCVLSVQFSSEATRLCLALQDMAGSQALDMQQISGVLQAAGKYDLMLDGSSCMTPTIVADIEARGLSEPWDRLALVANCCRYSIRLDGEALRQQRRSLSLSVLAMCLLNGEILDNSNDDTEMVANLTGSKVLHGLTFRAFNAPENESRRLTFYKGCRLIDVELTMGGVATMGHLWKLGRIIDTARFPQQLPRIDEPNGRLTKTQRRCLRQLVFYLYTMKHETLAHRIKEYLATDARAGKGYSCFTDKHLYQMAQELAAAILAGRKLRLGCIWDRLGEGSPYLAVFVLSEQSGIQSYPPTFVFTSVRHGDPGSEYHDANDIDCHVSLQVKEPICRDGVPQLRICGWLLGMCFFDGCPRTEVLFPWPRALQIV